MRIRLLPEAERDLEIGADFYESKRFPFSIYYVLTEDGVEVYAVLDARQDDETINAILDSSRTKR
ncbi:MAG: hypothetical protein U1A77_07835 [Pirellulales bacterium]